MDGVHIQRALWQFQSSITTEYALEFSINFPEFASDSATRERVGESVFKKDCFLKISIYFLKCHRKVDVNKRKQNKKTLSSPP